MATAEDVQQLRRMVAEPGTETYTDDALSAILDASGSLSAAAATVWQEKAGRAAKLVNVSESGSSRSMSDVHKNALRMAEYYSSQGGTADFSDAPTTAAIVRPS